MKVLIIAISIYIAGYLIVKTCYDPGPRTIGKGKDTFIEFKLKRR